ncbi:ribosomal protein [Lithospermum erythrorhizon]|uniref:Small ribosomal subunit protein mS29 n=1 Tax=Lithospermum erythrorhizon TaxID=34254 RepID=A0AAV3Q4T6_LITER
MLRSLLRSAASHSRTFATSKQTKGSLTKAKRSKPKSDELSASSSAAAEASDQVHDTLRAKLLADEAGNRALDVGPNGRPLFTNTTALKDLTKKDACMYMEFSSEELNKMLPEGLPIGMVKEFEESLRNGLLVRQGFLDLRDNFRRIVDPPMYSDGKGLKLRQQVVLDGPANCGKSIALAMLVLWARNEGWLVLYSPRGREWTHGGFFYKNPQTGLWDTPVQAANILQDFLKYNETVLQKLPCHVFDPIPLGEGAGVGLRKDIASISVPENSSLYDLIQIGINNTHAAVGVLVHLRKELSHVKDVPVLIAIDQYNSWFTFSEYGEANTVRSTRPIHANELSTVNAFRSMVDKDMMMVGAFSHTTSVGKLRQELPGVPSDARAILPRYSLDEAATVSHYYLRQRLVSRESFSEDGWKKIYYLANGNGAEMRWLVPFMR